MALNNSQYDEIFRSYDAKQLKAQHQLEERTKAAYERSPELKALDASIAEISVASAGKTWKTGERIKSICKDKGAGSGRKTGNDTAHSGKKSCFI